MDRGNYQTVLVFDFRDRNRRKFVHSVLFPKDKAIEKNCLNKIHDRFGVRRSNLFGHRRLSHAVRTIPSDCRQRFELQTQHLFGLFKVSLFFSLFVLFKVSLSDFLFLKQKSGSVQETGHAWIGYCTLVTVFGLLYFDKITLLSCLEEKKETKSNKFR